jgi:hypothetical protein
MLFPTRHNDAAMKENSLHFPSVSKICLFLKEMNRRNFVLLGKKLILIAPFSAEELAVAVKKYGAQLTDTTETVMADTNRTVTMFN